MHFSIETCLGFGRELAAEDVVSATVINKPETMVLLSWLFDDRPPIRPVNEPRTRIRELLLSAVGGSSAFEKRLVPENIALFHVGRRPFHFSNSAKAGFRGDSRVRLRLVMPADDDNAIALLLRPMQFA